VERDVRLLANIGDLDAFTRFVALCAGRAACLLNYSALGQDAGLTHPTVKKWISILRASYVVASCAQLLETIDQVAEALFPRHRSSLLLARHPDDRRPSNPSAPGVASSWRAETIGIGSTTSRFGRGGPCPERPTPTRRSRLPRRTQEARHA
jgi:hypothetical protein